MISHLQNGPEFQKTMLTEVFGLVEENDFSERDTFEKPHIFYLLAARWFFAVTYNFIETSFPKFRTILEIEKQEKNFYRKHRTQFVSHLLVIWGRSSFASISRMPYDSGKTASKFRIRHFAKDTLIEYHRTYICYVLFPRKNIK